MEKQLLGRDETYSVGVGVGEYVFRLLNSEGVTLELVSLTLKGRGVRLLGLQLGVEVLYETTSERVTYHSYQLVWYPYTDLFVTLYSPEAQEVRLELLADPVGLDEWDDPGAKEQC
jgi:hypothetical protein